MKKQLRVRVATKCVVMGVGQGLNTEGPIDSEPGKAFRKILRSSSPELDNVTSREISAANGLHLKTLAAGDCNALPDAIKKAIWKTVLDTVQGFWEEAELLPRAFPAAKFVRPTMECEGDEETPATILLDLVTNLRQSWFEAQDN